MSTRTTSVAWTAALALCASVALGQSTTPAKDDPGLKGTPIPMGMPRTKPMRKPVVDLEKMAKDRRPGQVMPGDPTPVAQSKGAAGAASMIPESMPATPPPAQGAIQLPDTSPAAKPTLKPSPEVSAAPIPAPAEATTPNPMPSAMSATDIPPPAAFEASMPAMSATPAPAAEAPAAPMAEVATPMPAMESTPSRPEPLPHIEAAPTRPEPIATKPEPSDSSGTIGGVGIVDKSIITAMPMALSTGPAKFRVERLSGDAGGIQWRAGGESAWRTPAVGDTAESRMEIRAGLDAEMVLTVDDRVQVRIGRLGRAVIERTEEPGGAFAMSIVLSRGAAEIRPLDAQPAGGRMFARVKTPDQVFGLTGPLRVEYDAFTGTRRRTLNP